MKRTGHHVDAVLALFKRGACSAGAATRKCGLSYRDFLDLLEHESDDAQNQCDTMMTNVECKYRCANLDEVARRAIALGAVDCAVLSQRDFFFSAPHARLKVRQFENGSGELIAYQRSDAGEARLSTYRICRVPQPEVLVEVLALALGVPREVRKIRRLLLYRATRIHLDRVEGLGDFAELETVVTTQSENDARTELDEASRALGLTDVVAMAYADMISRYKSAP